MEAFLEFLAPLRTLDPAAWVRLAHRIPAPAALFLCLGGLAAALFGEGRWFRLVGAPLGFLAGIVAGPTLAGHLHWQPTAATTVAAGVLAVAGGAFPPAVIFVSVGLCGALFGAALVEDTDFWLGFLPGFILAGSAAMLALRPIEAVLSSFFGGFLLVWGALRLTGVDLSAAPIVALGAVAAATVLGTAFQLKVRRTVEEVEADHTQDALDAQRRREDEERARRFAEYSRRGRGD